ncbi:hypothetical protein PR003_g23343 [Phytophthora rubi]|uniref:Secreted protein n=1 Tax=Phytophthora rubi TaxID=129364 RepID=A0A6A3IW92_9STRA|nr:hypothetical protein PR002_g22843 [Phytophthora rubi]KAE8987349.1 hypothetical protein PR001_g22350 [Phytophthora rubi]KAE9298051.1 hypothetical protein PR003_g23343 [Phytophthora rubi]
MEESSWISILLRGTIVLLRLTKGSSSRADKYSGGLEQQAPPIPGQRYLNTCACDSTGVGANARVFSYLQDNTSPSTPGSCSLCKYITGLSAGVLETLR